MRQLPLLYAERLISNRAIPWITRRAFRPGVQDVNGVRMLIPEPPRFGGGGEFHMALGTYEHRELQFVLSHLRPGDWFLDVGAHIGYFSLPAAEKVGPGGRVIAIEPTPSSAALLRENVALNGFDRITVIEAAASDRTGTGSLTTSTTSTMWNTLETDTLAEVDGVVTVKVTTIDDLLAELGYPRVTLMKMDVEGHEENVLAGARATMERNPDMGILFEVSGGARERMSASMGTLEYLSRLGFAFWTIDRGVAGQCSAIQELEQRMKMSRWQDHLFNVLATRADGAPNSRR
jgi:FkbM family methyltransferase